MKTLTYSICFSAILFVIGGCIHHATTTTKTVVPVEEENNKQDNIGFTEEEQELLRAAEEACPDTTLHCDKTGGNVIYYEGQKITIIQ